MLIERPPKIFRMLFPGTLFRMPGEEKRVYLTFDDGPVPEVTPWVLEVLDRYGIKATFFMVGDNARKYPELLAEVLRRGHDVGGHTMHHVQGRRMGVDAYMKEVKEGNEAIGGTSLFRPPHGFLTPGQLKAVRRSGLQPVMFDLVTRDYSRRLTPEGVVKNVKRYLRPRSIIVFHDSEKSARNTRGALEESIRYILDMGYEFRLIREDYALKEDCFQKE